MLHYVGDTKFTQTPVPAMLDKAHATRRAGRIHSSRAADNVEPSFFDGLTNTQGRRHDLSLGHRSRRQHRLADSEHLRRLRQLHRAAGCGFALHNRGGLFTLDESHPNALAPRKRPLHTIIPGFMRNGDTRIGFGIMGAFNQAQAHAQFVANIVDYGMDIQQALEAGRFTKATFAGADVSIEALVPEAVRSELAALGHEITTVPPRTGTFGHGQAVMSDGAGVHFGASEPRHDGAAIPQAAPAFG